MTVSFNLAPGMSLSDATRLVNQMQTAAEHTLHPARFFCRYSSGVPAIAEDGADPGAYSIAGRVYRARHSCMKAWSIPLTIISTLPSASVGAMLALMLFKIDLNVISIIGIVLLIGIVKKNAIMMIDFALVAEREGMSTADAIFEACMLRFRPILMTTMAALFGALPLAFGTGTGSELRRPLGITIVGGLIVSQALTLYTTPVIYLYMDRLRLRVMGRNHNTLAAPMGEAT